MKGECMSPNPFSEIEEINTDVTRASHLVKQVSESLNASDLSILEMECGGDVEFAATTVDAILNTLLKISANLDAALVMTDCTKLSPVFAGIASGMICTDSVTGLAWMYSLATAISIISMIMLTTRAALFNPIIQGKRRKRREREFEEYKAYMSDYYDTSDWKLDQPVGKVKKYQQGIDNALTFESEGTESSSSADELSPRSVKLTPSDDSMKTGHLNNLSTIHEVSKCTQSMASPSSNENDDDDISYYSADSDWEDDYDDNTSSMKTVVSSVSSMMSLVLERARRARRRSEPVNDDNSASRSVSTSVSDVVSKYFQSNRARSGNVARRVESRDNGNCMKSPPLTTPQRFRGLADSLSLGRHQGRVSGASNQEIMPLSPPFQKPNDNRSHSPELEPLSPAPQVNTRAPRKGMTSFARTSGGAKLYSM